MKKCTSCGLENAEDSRFCSGCGAVLEESNNAVAEEQSLLDGYYRFFKYERLAWKISGIFFLVFSLFFFGLGFIFLLISAFADSVAAEAGTAAMFGVFLMYGLLFLPVAIVNLKMVSRAEYYMNTLYTDITPVIPRTSSIGMFILSGFFNEIALIFIIINFIRTERNGHLLNRIAFRQGKQ